MGEGSKKRWGRSKKEEVAVDTSRDQMAVLNYLFCTTSPN